MTTESQIIARLRRFATDPAARGLADDAALLDGLVITHDTIAEGVHFLPFDPPASVGWKLVAVNLSDLAAKGATPRAALLSMAIGDPDWDETFIGGIEAACESYGVSLIGGDTIALPQGAPRVLGLTAIGKAGERVPSRAGGRPGDRLWLVGTLGDSAAGLAQLRGDPKAAGPLVDHYRRPVPLLAAGVALASAATAMMDVSDGLLIDLNRLCEASGCGAAIDLGQLPLSRAFVAERGQDRKARLLAATGGDDYALLAALPQSVDPLSLSLPQPTTIAAIGSLVDAPRIALSHDDEPVPLPAALGYEHSRP
jgi:thiamine-monophosphate kinase